MSSLKVSLTLDIWIIILDEVFCSFSFNQSYLELRLVDKRFCTLVNRIIFGNPFKYFKDKNLLVCLYIYFISDEDNAHFFYFHNIDLQLITKVYLLTKRKVIDKDKFKTFANNTIRFRFLLKEFDYYEFICSFCKLCMTSNGVLSGLNRFDLDDKLELALQYILKNNVLMDGVNLLKLNFYLRTKYEDNRRLFWIYKSTQPFQNFEKDKMRSLLNVDQISINVDYLDYDVILLLKNLDKLEKMEIEFEEHTSLSDIDLFADNIKELINHFRNLKILIFKNWKWSNKTFFRINSNNNLKRIELMDNRILVDEFWSICNPNILILQNCIIENRVMAKITAEFGVKLTKNHKGNYSTIY